MTSPDGIAGPVFSCPPLPRFWTVCEMIGVGGAVGVGGGAVLVVGAGAGLVVGEGGGGVFAATVMVKGRLAVAPAASVATSSNDRVPTSEPPGVPLKVPVALTDSQAGPAPPLAVRIESVRVSPVSTSLNSPATGRVLEKAVPCCALCDATVPAATGASFAPVMVMVKTAISVSPPWSVTV